MKCKNGGVLRHNQIKCLVHYITKTPLQKCECIKRADISNDSLWNSFIVTLVIIHLFLIINTLACSWQVESWPPSALHYTETTEKRKAHCSQVHVSAERIYSRRFDVHDVLLQSFNLTVKKRIKKKKKRKGVRNFEQKATGTEKPKVWITLQMLV